MQKHNTEHRKCTGPTWKSTTRSKEPVEKVSPSIAMLVDYIELLSETIILGIMFQPVTCI